MPSDPDPAPAHPDPVHDPRQHDLVLAGGRALRAFDTGGDGPALLWHHGSPQTGALIEPLLSTARASGFRLIGYARPGYPGSTEQPERTVAAAADDVRRLADALGVASFTTMGASGGGPHALACAALLPDRVNGAVTIAGLAPYRDGDEWFAGMASPDALRSARDGRAARAAYAEIEEFDESVFTEHDWATLSSSWRELGRDAGAALEAGGVTGLVDDDVAFAAPSWGFELAAVRAPVLLVHGVLDRMVPFAHAHQLLAELPAAQLWTLPHDGHVSALRTLGVALAWLGEFAGAGTVTDGATAEIPAADRPFD